MGSGEETDRVNGRAEEIRYTDSKRLIEYLNAPGGSPKRSSGTVRVTAPKAWDLEANSVEVFMGQDGGRAERLEAYQNVTARIDTKTATADRLTYLSAEDRYDMKGAGSVPVKVVDGCGESVGRTLTYYKGDNRMVVNGNDELRAQQSKKPGCQQPSP